jgi:hypothetical protein
MKFQIHLVPLGSVNLPTVSPNGVASSITHLWHYTTVEKLKLIINGGHIRPSTARLDANEKPVVWFSSRPTWEPTATKCPLAGNLGQIVTAAAQGGLARISVAPSTAPFIFPQLPLVAGTTPATCIGLLLAGFELGADPDHWRFTTEPVPVALFREVELFDFEQDRWRAIDMSELACRN